MVLQERLLTMFVSIENNKTVYLSTHTPLGYENLENKKIIDLENPPETVYPN